MVVTVGIDVHKQTHCAVAVDEAGRPVGKPTTVRATDAGHRQLLRWAKREFADSVHGKKRSSINNGGHARPLRRPV